MTIQLDINGHDAEKLYDVLKQYMRCVLVQMPQTKNIKAEQDHVFDLMEKLEIFMTDLSEAETETKLENQT